MSLETSKAKIANYTIRKWFTQVEEVHTTETGREADGKLLHKVVIAAAVQNPFAGSFGEDLSSLIERSDELGAEFGRRLKALVGDEEIQSYGKACLVGVNGEYDHGNAMLTQFAADPLRKAIGGGKAWVPSTGRVSAAGDRVDIPLAAKDALYVRSHYDTISTSFGDAPLPNEILVIWAFATRGRLNARLGGLELKDIVGEDGLQ